ncbi:hypothetical protein BCR34DRAFT_362695 [Clohesyomyces aquaticus]|uniref:Uncharacterized protein n=1 Tax=Clohesyomyces aquaticus TaxID=1231657 RepID=A0A1Y1ZI00_9PLEO|nr:hypothetical protein BCR34DRAFT_362695 [Clohesyomyces aquaticus]
MSASSISESAWKTRIVALSYPIEYKTEVRSEPNGIPYLFSVKKSTGRDILGRMIQETEEIPILPPNPKEPPPISWRDKIVDKVMEWQERCLKAGAEPWQASMGDIFVYTGPTVFPKTSRVMIEPELAHALLRKTQQTKADKSKLRQILKRGEGGA